jgi:hypothetical protein
MNRHSFPLVLLVALLFEVSPHDSLAAKDAKKTTAARNTTTRAPAQVQKSAAKDSTVSIRLPSGSMSLRTFGKWKWSDSCHSKTVACYAGSLESAGTGYLFSGPVPEGSANIATQNLCKDIFNFQSKYSSTAPAAVRPRALAIKKNMKGQYYCSWLKDNESTYFWKVGRSLVSISFTPARGIQGKPAAEAFWKEVERFASEVSFADK